MSSALACTEGCPSRRALGELVATARWVARAGLTSLHDQHCVFDDRYNPLVLAKVSGCFYQPVLRRLTHRGGGRSRMINDVPPRCAGLARVVSCDFSIAVAAIIATSVPRRHARRSNDRIGLLADLADRRIDPPAHTCLGQEPGARLPGAWQDPGDEQPAEHQVTGPGQRPCSSPPRNGLEDRIRGYRIDAPGVSQDDYSIAKGMDFIDWPGWAKDRAEDPPSSPSEPGVNDLRACPARDRHQQSASAVTAATEHMGDDNIHGNINDAVNTN